MSCSISSESQSKIQEQRRIRIRLSLAAYAYEFDDIAIISDAEFDWLSNLVIPDIKTGHDKMDKFFQKEFHPYTGMWIHKHPELRKLKYLYYFLRKQGLLEIQL